MRVQLLGAFAIWNGSQKVDKFETRKVAQLAAILAAEPGRSWDRDHLCEILWPGEDAEFARPRMRQALASLRKSLASIAIDPDEFLDQDRVSVALRADTDLETARRHLGNGRPDECFEIVGEFVPGFTGEWFDQRRLGIKSDFERALGRWVEEESPAQIERMPAIAEGMVASDPLNEPLVRAAMRAHLRFGDPSRARSIFEEFQERLKRELSLSPSPETLALVSEIRRPADRVVIAPKESTKEAPLPKSNVRRPLGPIFGRLEDLATLDDLAADESVRLVSLTGPGGIGKTSLSSEWAWRAKNSFEGIWNLELAAEDRADRILSVIVETLGISRRGAASELDLIEDCLGENRVALVLDNLEQFGAEAADPVLHLLQRCPELFLVVTTRHRLGLSFETELRLEPLPAANSVELFAARARQCSPKIGDLDPDLLREVCERLDGLPLAICLAASRMDVMTLGQIEAQIQDRFRILETKQADVPDRHRRLWTSIEWSYDQLPDYKRAFRDLGVFRGGWTAEAAGKVLAIDDIEGVLQHFVQRSLIVEESRDEVIRFGMLETLREFALEVASSEEREATRAKHAAFYREMARALTDKLPTGEFTLAAAAIEADYENIRATFEYLMSIKSDEALGLADEMGGFFYPRQQFHEGLAWSNQALAAVPDGDATRTGECLVTKANFCQRLARFEEGRQCLLQAKALFEQTGNMRMIGHALNSLASNQVYTRQWSQAVAAYRESMAHSAQVGDSRMLAAAQANCAHALIMMGSYDEAEELVMRALAYNESVGNKNWHSNNLQTLANLWLGRGDYERARAYLSESCAMLEEMSIDPARGGRHVLTAEIMLRQGAIDEGLGFLKNSFEASVKSGELMGISEHARIGALYAQNQGDSEAASRFDELCNTLSMGDPDRPYRATQDLVQETSRLIGQL